MRLQTIFSLILLLPCWLIGQSGDHSVIGAGGGTAEGQTMRLEWTLGETAISTVQHEKGLLTEGFHQPVLETEVVDAAALPTDLLGSSHTLASLQMTAAPNPVTTELQVELQSDQQQEGLLELVSPTGQQLVQYAVMMDFHRTAIEMGAYPGGTYFLLLRNEQGQILKAIKVIKIR